MQARTPFDLSVNLHIIILFMSSSIVPFIICLFYNNGSETFVAERNKFFDFLLSVSIDYKEEGKNAQGSESFVVSNMFFVFLWVFIMTIA